MKEKIHRYATFNVTALLDLAQRLRGRPCTCDSSKSPKSGSLNWAIFVTFDDGVDWVFRSPRSSHFTKLRDETASKMLISEASTLKYMTAHCGIPVPEVYAYSGSEENDIGIPYILESKAPGRALSDYDWFDVSREPPGYELPWPLLPLSDEDRQKVMRQLGTIMARLSEIRFDKIGSISEDDQGRFHIGECLSPSLVWQWRDSLDAVTDRGPFPEECHYLNSLILAFTSHAKDLPLNPHVFFAPLPDSLEYPTWDSLRAAVDRWNDFIAVGDKTESSRNRLSYCIAGQFLRDMVPQLQSTADGGFTLSHPDLHLGNIFVDEDLNITCLIDWGFTTSGPITELLATPGLEGSTSLPPRSQTDAFRSSFDSVTSKIEPNEWNKADMMWLFSRLVRLLSKQDLDLFKALYEIVFESENGGLLGSVDYARLFQQRAQDDSNKRLSAELREDDPSKDEARKHEEAAFCYAEERKWDSLAIARKVTLMSEMNAGFVADKRLWRWIEDALKH
ncbi:hypothetical protein G7046_g3883 [Stylonectria norvegica]|nr:hypothetical protein G7046_g3883 [Stylonectria norvegica]